MRTRLSMLNAAIGCLGLLLAVNAVVAYLALGRISAANLRLQSAQEVLTELRSTLTLLLECETGQRGYIITGKREYLAPYERALGELGGHLVTLESHAAGNPVLAARLPELKSFSNQKLKELAQTLDLAENGQHTAAVKVVMSDTGKQMMDHLRLVIEAMINEQQAIVAESVARQRDSSRSARITLFMASGVAIFFLLVIGLLLRREARTRAAAEEKLRLAEKLTATARLAHAMSHYVNNPLEALSNCIYLAKQDPQLNENTRHLLEMAEEQAARAGHVSKQTLGLRRLPKRAAFAATKLLDEVVALYTDQARAKNIQFLKEYSCDGTLVADKDDVREAVANLVSNAIDACEDSGTVRIQTSAEQQGIAIAVEDNGRGVAPEDQQRLFNPFFTTKSVGAGLGLWAAKQIVESYGGSISFVSSDGRTKFSITLPVESSEPASEAAAS